MSRARRGSGKTRRPGRGAGERHHSKLVRSPERPPDGAHWSVQEIAVALESAHPAPDRVSNCGVGQVRLLLSDLRDFAYLEAHAGRDWKANYGGRLESLSAIAKLAEVGRRKVFIAERHRVQQRRASEEEDARLLPTVIEVMKAGGTDKEIWHALRRFKSEDDGRRGIPSSESDLRFSRERIRRLKKEARAALAHSTRLADLRAAARR
jgi:hypothetical protein